MIFHDQYAAPQADLILFGAGCGAVLGAVIGSWLACILIRWPTGADAIGGRSRCDSCGRALPWHSLIPVISYLAQRGRCRQCGAGIRPDHLAMELGAALIGGLAGAWAPIAPPDALAGALFGWQLLLLAALDVRHFWLPDRLTLLLAASGLGAQLLGTGPGFVSAFAGIAIGWVSLSLVALAYRRLRGREGLGGGDPKLLAAIGAWLGWQALPWLVLMAAGIGLATATLLAMRRRQVRPTTPLPLGALFALAAWPLWWAAQVA